MTRLKRETGLEPKIIGPETTFGGSCKEAAFRLSVRVRVLCQTPTGSPRGGPILQIRVTPEPGVLLSLGPDLMLRGWLDQRRRRANGRRASSPR